MYSNRSEYSQRRLPTERSSRYEYDDRRHFEDYGERREERREPHRDRLWDSHPKYSMEGRRSPERTSRGRDYSDSPKRLYSKEPVNRDWRRKSPVRRRMSSPSWDEKKRPRFAEEDERDYRYRSEAQGKTYRQPSDSSSHEPKDYRKTPPREEDYKYRKTAQVSRHRHAHEEFTYRHYDGDSDAPYRRQCYRDEGERSRDRSPERPRSQDHTTAKSYSKSRESPDSLSTSMYEDRHHNRTKSLLNGSSGQSFESDVPSQSVSVSEDKFSKGFQRFLDVLNRGVNVDVLTKIVTQRSAGVNVRPRSPSFHPKPAERPWPERSRHENNCWGNSEGSQRPVSPQPHHRSLSPQQVRLSDETCLQRSDVGGRSLFDSRAKSPPSGLEAMTLTPEDEHKCRQMQDVLQAIGLDLGFEELGQMSHRIQERLYGKKDGDWGRKTSREGGARRAFSPKRQSRSSSSRSSFSPLPQDYYTKTDSRSTQREETEVHQNPVPEKFDQSSNSLQDAENPEANAKEHAAASQAFSPGSLYAEPRPAPVMPTYSPINHSPLHYPPVPPPALPPPMCSSLPAVLPPCLPAAWPPHTGRRVLLPYPPMLPYPGVRPLNFLPHMLAQTRNFLPPHMNNLPFNLPAVNTVQHLNTQQKSKQPSRPRCLQVIETKQPG